MLPLHVLPLVELRVSTSCNRTYQWCYATYKFRLLWLLQCTSPPRRHRPRHYRTRQRGHSVCAPDFHTISILTGYPSSDKEMMENFETLVRSILLRPDHPA